MVCDTLMVSDVTDRYFMATVAVAGVFVIVTVVIAGVVTVVIAGVVVIVVAVVIVVVWLTVFFISLLFCGRGCKRCNAILMTLENKWLQFLQKISN